MDNTALAKYRARIIEDAINIETLIELAICQAYFGKVVLEFRQDVLYDDYFSFGFKAKVLRKILERMDERGKIKLTREDKAILDSLEHRLVKIRNVFAHRAPNFVRGGNKEIVIAPDPKDHSKDLDFEKLYKEFSELTEPTLVFLFKVLKALGAELG